MKRIASLVFLFAVGLVASSMAVANPGPGTPPGKGNHDASACRPRISLILAGSFVSGSADASGAGSFTMDVKRANHHARLFAGKQATVNVDANTRYRRGGHAKLSDFAAGDRLNVQVRACKRPGDAAPTMLAKRLMGHPAATATTETTTSETTTASQTTTTTP
jgi:hypothetical protein